MTTTSELTAQRVQTLRDYFKEYDQVIHIDAYDQSYSCREMCSMEHINCALGDEDDENTADAPAGCSQGMASLLVAFNDATSEACRNCDTWRHELLPRYPEATDSQVADRRRLRLSVEWLAAHGVTTQKQVYLNGNAEIRVGSEGFGAISFYDLLEERFHPDGGPNAFLPEALGISAEDYIAFLHTLINP